MKRILLGTAVFVALGGAPGISQQKTIKIGFISTFTGPPAVIGNDMRNSFELALEHLSRKIAGKPIEVIYEDDQSRPDVGLQKSRKLIESDRVDFVVGFIWSNALLASLKPIVDSQTFLISSNAGPSQIAGERCSPFFFSTSSQNAQTGEAVGHFMNKKGIKTVFLVGPNYPASIDLLLGGVFNTFKGEMKGSLTSWPDRPGPASPQTVIELPTVIDPKYGVAFGPELPEHQGYSGIMLKIRALKPDAVFAFYPGAASVRFLEQYAQSGLKGEIPLYTAFTIDETTLPVLNDLAFAVFGAQQWVNDLPNEMNRKFVADYKAKHQRGPSFYGAQSYDALNLINSAVIAANGNVDNKDAMRDEMRKANYASVRGPYKYGNNHFPIQNFYLQEVIKDTDGSLGLKTISTIAKDSQDQFHDKCPMKW
jgi:branched-chain amino acid transport system substrate-binding protein